MRSAHAHGFTCGGGGSSPGGSSCHKQNGLCGTNHYSDNQTPAKSTWTKNPEPYRIAEVVSQGHSMTWGESLQCQMVRVGVSQCPTGGWPNHQGTDCLMHHSIWHRTKRGHRMLTERHSGGGSAVEFFLKLLECT